MEEARPRIVSAPAGEPLLSVGVVLPGDKTTKLIVLPPARGYRIEGGGLSIEAESEKELSFISEGQSVHLLVDGLEAAAAPGFRLFQNSPCRLTPAAGLRVDSVVVGREFHWRRRMVQYLDGDLEITNSDGFLQAVNHLAFESYIASVISSEMSPDCPVEFCKAQAVAARSWARVFLGTKHDNPLYSICNDDDCQRYQGTGHITERVIDAVEACRGEFLVTDGDTVLPAYYSKCCGGHTEAADFVFGFSTNGLSPSFDCARPQGRALEFLNWLDCTDERARRAWCAPGVVDRRTLSRYLGVVDVPRDYYRWIYRIGVERLISNLRQRFGLDDAEIITGIEFSDRGVSGRLGRACIEYEDVKGRRKNFILSGQYDLRRAFHDSFLYSSAFECGLEYSDDGNVSVLKFRGCGWGHGVGLCQFGALGQALAGHDYRKILTHYYPGATIRKSY